MNTFDYAEHVVKMDFVQQSIRLFLDRHYIFSFWGLTFVFSNLIMESRSTTFREWKQSMHTSYSYMYC